MTLSNHTKSRLDRIQNEYNPEYDIPPGPPVTWAEMDLTEAVLELAAKVAELEARLGKPAPPARPVHSLTCPNCRGTGAAPLSDNVNWLPCPTCQGKGVI